MNVKALAFGILYHMLCAVAPAVPKGYQPVGNITHQFIAFEASTAPMTFPVCWINFERQSLLVGKLLPKQVRTFGMTRHYDELMFASKMVYDRQTTRPQIIVIIEVASTCNYNSILIGHNYSFCMLSLFPYYFFIKFSFNPFLVCITPLLMPSYQI